MITISDNGAALALWHILGGANVDVTLQKAGIADFHVALDESADHWATPRAVGKFFTLLARRQLISPAASDRMLARLERQQINNRLPAQLPAGVVVAHKTGNLVGATHDAGIIYTKSGPRVVVAMTWDALDEDADNFISSVGASVYSAILEPSANARYQVAKNAIAAEVGTQSRVIVPITNVGTRAATARFMVRAHQPYVVTAQIGMPRQLHRSEASLLVVNYAAIAGTTDRPLSIGWRVIDPRTNHTVEQGSSPVGALKAGANGTFFVSFLAPNVLGIYRLTYELSDGSAVLSEPVSTTVEIQGPRTYPDDEGGRPIPTSQSRT